MFLMKESKKPDTRFSTSTEILKKPVFQQRVVVAAHTHIDLVERDVRLGVHGGRQLRARARRLAAPRARAAAAAAPTAPARAPAARVAAACNHPRFVLYRLIDKPAFKRSFNPHNGVDNFNPNVV